jgi:serine protease Do
VPTVDIAAGNPISHSGFLVSILVELRTMNNIKVSLLVAIVCLLPLPGLMADEVAEPLRESSKAFAAVAQSVSPSVAFINVEGRAQAPSMAPFSSPFDDEFLRRFFGDQFPQSPRPGQPREQPRTFGQGSGFVYSVVDGLTTDTTYLLTNNHVVENADKITVTFPGGREFTAEVTGRDPKSDIAVIEIETADIPALTLADSSDIDVGEWVVAIGNPFGLSHTLTVGVVSAKGRTSVGINDYEDFIQTDAAINPGNSGGPLVNLDGAVVGINTAIFSRSGGYMGIGFAIPINLAKGIAEQLIETGTVTRGQLGVVIQPLTSDLARSFSIEPGQGILVAQVNEDSPADQGGIETGDIIVEFSGEPVTEIGSFRNAVALTPPGSRRDITVVRDGKRRELSVTIGQQDDEVVLARDETASAGDLGITVQSLTPQLAEQLDVEPGSGVVISDVAPGSVAAQSGIRRGAVILEVDRQSVSTPGEFERAVASASAARRVLLLVSMDGVQRYVALNW